MDNVTVDIRSANIFQEDNLVLSDVNLTLGKGEFAYLIGRVGSGKTSLIKTITAEIPLKDGNAVVCGFEFEKVETQAYPKVTAENWRRFQDFQLLTDRSVYNNLLFVLKATGWKDKSAIKQRIAEVLDMVELKFKDYKMPHQLSGGNSNAW